MLKLSGFESTIKQDPKDKSQYIQYTPKQSLNTMFLFCDLFLQSTFLRKHYKQIKVDKLTFEYEGNLTLAKLNKKGMIDIFYRIAEQLLAAVYACHQHKIPGRCFNPDNILWNEKNQHIVLMEFGLAPELELIPPELSDPESKCYGVEIDQFLIGNALYQLWFGKPLIISSDYLKQNEKQLNQELEQIGDITIKRILQGLLNFKFAKRMKLHELASILGVGDNIQNYYSPQNVDFQRTCEMIDQKIFFREAGDSVFANPLFIQTQNFQSSIYTPSTSLTNSFRSIVCEKTVDFKKQLTDQITMFQCFDDTITIQKQFNQDFDPIILLSTLGFIKCKIHFLKKFKDEIQEQNSTYFISSQDESSLWRYFVKKESKFISKTKAEIEQLLSKTTISSTLTKEVDEMTKIIYRLNRNELSEYQANYKVDLKQAVQNLNNNCSFEEFLLQYKNASLVMLKLIENNPDFTGSMQKSLLLKIQILLCCFADYFFINEKNINYLEIVQKLNGQPYNQQNYINKFSTLLQSLKQSKFANEFIQQLNKFS